MDKISIISDLHLEFLAATPQLKPTTPFLALLGDIGNPKRPLYRQFINTVAEQYEKVFIVNGNHEYYKNSMQEGIRVVESIVADVNGKLKREALVFLNRTAYDLDEDTVLLGSTLWSRLDLGKFFELTAGYNDFNMILGCSWHTYNRWHEEDVAWLTEGLGSDKTEGKNVFVFTHHAPLMEGTSAPAYDGSPLSSAFATDLRQLINTHNKKIKAWAFGHTHCRTKFKYNGVIITSNPVGYKNELGTRFQQPIALNHIE